MAQNRMRQQEEKHRSERGFEVGDWVFLGYNHIKRCPSINKIRTIN
jgi:hypothetical protein